MFAIVLILIQGTYKYIFSLNRETVLSTNIGKILPNFTLTDIKNKHDITNKNLDEKASIMFFFASWCNTCHTQLPVLTHIKHQYDLNIYLIAWNDTIDNLQSWLKYDKNFYDKILLDNTNFGINLGVYAVPTFFIIDENQIIIYNHLGSIDKKFIDFIHARFTKEK